MATVTFAIPDELLARRRQSPAEFARVLRLAAAMFWYSRGEVSMERAAQIADLCIHDFLLALGRAKVDAFQVDIASLRRELERG